MNLESDALDEVIVGDVSVAVLIEKLEDDILLSLRKWEAPVFKEKHQFIFLYVWITIFVKILKSFPDSAPLLTDLVDETVEDLVIGYEVFCGESFIEALYTLLLLQILFV